MQKNYNLIANDHEYKTSRYMTFTDKGD